MRIRAARRGKERAAVAASRLAVAARRRNLRRARRSSSLLPRMAASYRSNQLPPKTLGQLELPSNQCRRLWNSAAMRRLHRRLLLDRHPVATTALLLLLPLPPLLLLLLFLFVVSCVFASLFPTVPLLCLTIIHSWNQFGSTLKRHSHSAWKLTHLYMSF